MTFFIDTSAFLAVLDADDENHQKAKKFYFMSRIARIPPSSLHSPRTGSFRIV
jgi:hypothetical protein